MNNIINQLLMKYQLERKKELMQKAEWISSLVSGADGEKAADAGTDNSVQLAETRLYIGLNDGETKKQEHDTEHYLSGVKEICFKYKVPFSIGTEKGGYYHEDGEYVEEETLVLTLIEAEKDTVEKIANDIRVLFNQESVLIVEDIVKGRYITG